MTVVEDFCQDISKYYPDKEDFYSWYIVFCVVNGILSLFAIFGNMVIICALTRTCCSLSPSKILLLSLAISDFGVGLVVQPLYITVFVEILLADSSLVSQCQSKLAFLVVGTFLAGVSFFTVSAISFDRFLAINLHLRYRGIVTEKRMTVVLAVLWGLSAIAAVGYIFMGDITREAVSTTFNIIFFVTTTITFVRIYLVARRHRLQIRTDQRTQESYKELAMKKRKFKSAISVLYVYIVFSACYLPYSSTMLVVATTSHGIYLKGIFQLGLTLGFLNSSLNPIIFCWRMREIRGHVMEILTRIFTCWKMDQVTQISDRKLSMMNTSYFRKNGSNTGLSFPNEKLSHDGRSSYSMHTSL